MTEDPRSPSISDDGCAADAAKRSRNRIFATALTLTIVASLIAFVAWPALHRARHGADGIKDASNLRSIVNACLIYAQDNNSIGPSDIRTLVEEGLLDPEELDSVYPDVNDGGGDYFLRPNAPCYFENDVIIAYSRAGYAHDGRSLNPSVNAAYADGHVSLMHRDDFHDVLENEKHRDVDWNLPQAGR